MTIIKRTLFEAIFILLIAIFISFVTNSIRKDGLPIFSKTPIQPKIEDNLPFKTISVNDAIKSINDNCIFVDARNPIDYENDHIKGAVNLPAKDFDMYFDKFFVQVDPEKKIITYCSGIDCPLAKDLAEKLYQAGYTNIYYMPEGLSKWNTIKKQK